MMEPIKARSTKSMRTIYWTSRSRCLSACSLSQSDWSWLKRDEINAGSRSRAPFCDGLLALQAKLLASRIELELACPALDLVERCEVSLNTKKVLPVCASDVARVAFNNDSELFVRSSI
jgi:hypothetical protein